MRQDISYIALMLLVVLNAPSYAQGLFGLKTEYDAGDGPHSVFSADLDGDGDSDLAITNVNSDSISVLFNNGDGTFSARVDYAAGFEPLSVFSVDLDGDGDNDLAVANGFSDNVSVLLNKGDGTFADAMDYAVGINPRSVFSKDLDGDGDNDIAAPNAGSNSVSVLFNTGDGTFSDKVDYVVGFEPISLFSADLDGDGDSDLAVANAGFISGNVSVLLNNGDGQFADKVDYDAGSSPSSVFISDLDGDGDSDLAVANAGFISGNVSVLLNNGDGQFADKVDYDAGSSPSSVFISDLDGDGDNDLAVANAGFISGNVSVLLNNGDGQFALTGIYGAGDGPHSVFISDLDDDGDNDLAVANQKSHNVSVLLNLSATLVASVSPTPDPRLSLSGINQAQDTELSGVPEAVADSTMHREATLAFQDSVVTDVAVSVDTIIAETPADPSDTVDVTATEPHSLADTLLSGISSTDTPSISELQVDHALGDSLHTSFVVQDTSALDIAVPLDTITAEIPAHPSDTVNVIATRPDSPADTLLSGIYSADTASISELQVDHALGDSLHAIFVVEDTSALDIAVPVDTITAEIPAHPSDTVDVIATKPDGPADAPPGGFAFIDIPAISVLKADYAVGDGPYSVFVSDLDGDRDNDLAVANQNSDNVSVLLNNGDGKFADKVDYAVGDEPMSVFISDLDGDGDNDIAVANKKSGTVSVLLNNGDGQFIDKVDYAAGNDPYSVFGADLDGDGDKDLVVTNTGSVRSTVSVLLNNGDGQFADKMNYSTGADPRSVFSADLDGDGDNDLAVANVFSDNVSVLLNNGDGLFADRLNYDVGGSPRSVFSADLDGDGDNDLAVANVFSDNVSVLLNNGDGQFADRVDYAAGDGPYSIFSTDLDGDGDNDIAVANKGSDNVSVLLNRGDGTFTRKVDYGAGNRPYSVFISDLDGDGDNDLAVANSSDDNVSVLLNPLAQR